MVETAISVLIASTTFILAYLGRTTDTEYMKGLFSVLSVYFLMATTNLARIFAEDSLANPSLTAFLGYLFVVMLLVSLFVTIMAFYQLFIYLVRLLSKKKGVNFEKE